VVGFLLVDCYCLDKLVFSGQIVSPVHVIFDLEGHKVCTLFWLWVYRWFDFDVYFFCSFYPFWPWPCL